MKRFAILVFAIAAVILSGCKKDEKQEEFSLAGTTWVGEATGDEFYVFRFKSENEVELTIRSGSITGPIRRVEPGEFTLSYPVLSIITHIDETTSYSWECKFIDEHTFRAKDVYDILVEFISNSYTATLTPWRVI